MAYLLTLLHCTMLSHANLSKFNVCLLLFFDSVTLRLKKDIVYAESIDLFRLNAEVIIVATTFGVMMADHKQGFCRVWTEKKILYTGALDQTKTFVCFFISVLLFF